MSERQTTGRQQIGYTIYYGGFAQQGWQCPICKKVLAPFITYCPFHDTENDKWSVTSATGTSTTEEAGDIE